MATVKPSKEVLQAKYNRRNWLYSQIQKSEMYLKNKDSDFWRSIKEEAVNKLLKIEEELDTYEKYLSLSNSSLLAKLVGLLEGRKQMRGFADMVDFKADNRVNYEKELLKLNEEIKEYEQKLQSVG